MEQSGKDASIIPEPTSGATNESPSPKKPRMNALPVAAKPSKVKVEAATAVKEQESPTSSDQQGTEKRTGLSYAQRFGVRMPFAPMAQNTARREGGAVAPSESPATGDTAQPAAERVKKYGIQLPSMNDELKRKLKGRKQPDSDDEPENPPQDVATVTKPEPAVAVDFEFNTTNDLFGPSFARNSAAGAELAENDADAQLTAGYTLPEATMNVLDNKVLIDKPVGPRGRSLPSRVSTKRTQPAQQPPPQLVDIDTVDGMEVSAEGETEPLVISPVETKFDRELGSLGEKSEENNAEKNAESSDFEIKVMPSGDEKMVEISARVASDGSASQMHTQSFTSTTEEHWLAGDDGGKLFKTEESFQRVAEFGFTQERCITETSAVSMKLVSSSTVTADDLWAFDHNSAEPVSPPSVDYGYEQRSSIEFKKDDGNGIQQHSTVFSSFDPFHADLELHSSPQPVDKSPISEIDRNDEHLLSFGDEEPVLAATEPIKADKPECSNLFFEETATTKFRETATSEFRNEPSKETKRGSSLLYFDEPSETVEPSISSHFLLESMYEPQSESSLLDFGGDRTTTAEPEKADRGGLLLFDKDETTEPVMKDKFDSGFLIVDENVIAALPSEPSTDAKFGEVLFSSIDNSPTLEFSAEKSELEHEPFIFGKKETTLLSTEPHTAADNSDDDLVAFDRPKAAEVEFSAEPTNENKFDDGSLLFEFGKHEAGELSVEPLKQVNKFDDDFSFFDSKTSLESKPEPEPVIDDKRGSSLLDFDDAEVVQPSVSIKLSAEPVDQQEVRFEPLPSEADTFVDVSAEPAEQPDSFLLDFGGDGKSVKHDKSATVELDKYGFGHFESGAAAVSDRPAENDKPQHVDLLWNDHDKETRFTTESRIELEPGADLFQSSKEKVQTGSIGGNMENVMPASISFLPEQDLIIVSTDAAKPCDDSKWKHEEEENFGVSMVTVQQQSVGHDKDSKSHITEIKSTKETGELSSDHKRHSGAVISFSEHIEKRSTEEKPCVTSATLRTTTAELFEDEKPVIAMSTFPEESEESSSEKKLAIVETTILNMELSPEEKPGIITVSTFHPVVSEEHSPEKKPAVIESRKLTVKLSPEKKADITGSTFQKHSEEVTPEKKPSITMSTFPKQTEETSSRISPTFEQQTDIISPEVKPRISMATFPKQSTDGNVVPQISQEETVLTLERSLSNEDNEWNIYSAVPYRVTRTEQEKDSAAKTSDKGSRLSTASKEPGPVATETTEKRAPGAKNILNYEISPVHAVSGTRTSWREKLKEQQDEEQKFDLSPSKTRKDLPEPEVKGASISVLDRSPTSEERITVTTSVTLEHSKVPLEAERSKDTSRSAEITKSVEVVESRKSEVKVTKLTNGAGSAPTSAIDTPPVKMRDGRISGTTTSTTRTVTETYSGPLFPKTSKVTSTPSTEQKRADVKVPLSVQTKELSPNSTPETCRFNIRTSATLSPNERSLSKTPSTDSDSPKAPEAWTSVLNRRSMTPVVVKPAGTVVSNTNLYLDIRSRLKHVQKPAPIVPVIATEDAEPATNPLYSVKRRSGVPDPLLLSPKSPAADSDSPPPFLVEWQRRKSCASPGIRPAGNSRALPTVEQSEPEFKRKAAVLTAKHRQHSQSIEA